MRSPLLRALRRPAGEPSFTLFLVTVLLCLFRARDLPALDLAVAGTSVSVGPADVALVLTGALGARRLLTDRGGGAPWLLVAATVFAALVVASAVPNGATALSAAGKLSLFAGLTLGAAAFLRTRERLEALVELVVVYAAVAVFWGAVGFVADTGRQGSFLGEHDLAALSSIAVGAGLARLHAGGGRRRALTAVAIGAGVLGVVLGASLASLLGLYLVVAAVLAAVLARRALRPVPAALTLLVAAVATAGTLALRSGELGFLQAWFGPEPETPGQYAASWSQRLIFAYIGGRVFLDRPVVGTGWQGELPPEDFARYLPDARARFDDQPPHYFPRADGTLIPQQAYDQILFQLGLVGAALALAVGLLALAAAVRAARRAAPAQPWGHLELVPLAWLAAVAGALAGAALFGGSPLTAALWLTLGVVAACARPLPGDPGR